MDPIDAGQGGESAAVGRHYNRAGLLESIFAALRADGKDPERVTPDDLAPVDQFHSGGKPATLALARRAGLQRDWRVLDAGGGLGGPARTLATEFGCEVTVLDLSEDFCASGAALSQRIGLAERVHFRQGSALATPFADCSFDLVWTQHSSMNVEDKAAVYREFLRVLRPGSRLAIHEVMAGPTQPVRYPVPWATDPAISFVSSPATIRALITNAGFVELLWEDESDVAQAFFQRLASAPRGPTPALSLALLLGDDAAAKLSNMRLNLIEQRTVVVQAVFERP